MANLSITTVCNKQCPYCFAEDAMQSSKYSSSQLMSLERVTQSLDYLDRSGIRQVRILGGEPTIHPLFCDMLDLVLARNFSILLFTNGLMPESVLDKIDAIPNEQITLLLNVHDPLEGRPETLVRQEVPMARLGQKIMPGINLFSREQKLDHILSLIDKHNLFREIRIGISHPIIAQSNAFLPPKYYPAIGLMILDLHHKAKLMNIKLGFDCGFVPCMFPETSWQELEKLMESTGNCCNPIVDLLPDGNFISCYPLSEVKQIKLTNQLTAQEVVTEFEQSIHDYYASYGIYPECNICPLFKQKRCSGGCVAQKMKRASL